MNIKRKIPVLVVAFSLLLLVGCGDGGFGCVDVNPEAIAPITRITFLPAVSEADAGRAR